MTPDRAISDAAVPVSSARDWFVLLKPRVLTLVVFTGVIGLIIAPAPIHPVIALAATLAIAVAAGAAGAINMWYDRDIDALMRRTANRPIPAGRIVPSEALGFGVTLAGASIIIMALAANLVAAALLALSIAFYVFVYTIWLKRRTPQNIVIGGAAGAFPPVIGWAAVTGDVGLLPALMFLIVFLWTPPHFWSLSLFASGDYARAGIPMLPVVAGARTTRRHIMAYTVVLVAGSLIPWAIGVAGSSMGPPLPCSGPVSSGNPGGCCAIGRTRRESASRGTRRRSSPSDTRSTTCSFCSPRWRSIG